MMGAPMTIRADRNNMVGVIRTFIGQRRDVVTFQVWITLIILKRRPRLAELARTLRPFQSIDLNGAFPATLNDQSGLG